MNGEHLFVTIPPDTVPGLEPRDALNDRVMKNDGTRPIGERSIDQVDHNPARKPLFTRRPLHSSSKLGVFTRGRGRSEQARSFMRRAIGLTNEGGCMVISTKERITTLTGSRKGLRDKLWGCDYRLAQV